MATRTPKAAFAAMALGAAALLLLPDHGRASAPAGRYALSNGNVVDTVTGLTWQQTVEDTGRTEPLAETYCQTLHYGGFTSGWRLPSISELETLVDRSVHSPAIDTGAFPGIPLRNFWSSTPDAADSSKLWLISFDSDGQSDTDSYDYGHATRCVR